MSLIKINGYGHYLGGSIAGVLNIDITQSWMNQKHQAGFTLQSSLGQSLLRSEPGIDESPFFVYFTTATCETGHSLGIDRLNDARLIPALA